MKYYSIIAVLALTGCVSGNPRIDTPREYAQAIRKHVEMRFHAPPDHTTSYDCELLVSQDDLGNIVAIEHAQCDEDENLINTFVKAIKDASPLPLPDDMTLLEKDLAFRFCDECAEAN